MFRQTVELVPDFDELARVRVNAEFLQHIADIAGLRLGVAMRHVAHMQDQVGLDDFFQRGAERSHEHGRQVRDESDGVGQDDAIAMRQVDGAQGRIERREQHVGGQHRRFGQPVEQCRLAGIGVTDQRDNRIRHALAAFAMQAACALDAFEIEFDARDALPDQAAIGFDLRFAGAAKKSEAAALAFKMCP